MSRESRACEQPQWAVWRGRQQPQWAEGGSTVAINRLSQKLREINQRACLLLGNAQAEVLLRDVQIEL